MNLEKTEHEYVNKLLLSVIAGVGVLLLIKRWLDTPNCSATGVSRRRRIFKDNLKPTPLTPCDMHPPGNKKTGNKKSYSHIPEEEHHGKRGRKGHQPSQVRPESLLTPRHMPFPYIPVDGEILFESMNCIFMVVALGLQLVNVYRTAWWAPNSFSRHAVNFHLINVQLVLFSISMLTCRVAYLLFLTPLKQLLAQFNVTSHEVVVRIFVVSAVALQLFNCAYKMLFEDPIIHLFYLLYPLAVYIIVFGLKTRPLLSLNNERPAMHSCTNDPVTIREEILWLRDHFNYRIKNILFSSFMLAYYTSFVPICFAQSYVFFDIYSAILQTFVVFGTMFCRLSSQMLSSHYCDVLHRSTMHLGHWKEIIVDPLCEPPVWTATKLYGRGSKVFYEGKVYICTTQCAAADPTNRHFRRFYNAFSNPGTITCGVLGAQIALIVAQIIMLFTNLHWNLTLSVVLILFMNNYTVFKLLRDYVITWRVYRAEYLIQEKPFENIVQ